MRTRTWLSPTQVGWAPREEPACNAARLGFHSQSQTPKMPNGACCPPPRWWDFRLNHHTGGYSECCPPGLSQGGTLLPTAKWWDLMWVRTHLPKSKIVSTSITAHTTFLTSQLNEGLYPAVNHLVIILTNPWHYRPNKNTATPNPTHPPPKRNNYNLNRIPNL